MMVSQVPYKYKNVEAMAIKDDDGIKSNQGNQATDCDFT